MQVIRLPREVVTAAGQCRTLTGFPYMKVMRSRDTTNDGSMGALPPEGLRDHGDVVDVLLGLGEAVAHRVDRGVGAARGLP